MDPLMEMLQQLFAGSQGAQIQVPPMPVSGSPNARSLPGTNPAPDIQMPPMQIQGNAGAPGLPPRPDPMQMLMQAGQMGRGGNMGNTGQAQRMAMEELLRGTPAGADIKGMLK